MKKMLLLVLCLGISAVSGPVRAMLEEEAQVAPEAGVVYITGGVGEEERTLFRSYDREFNLKLVFAEQSGSYLADVDVEIVNARGETVLRAYGAGPLLLASLPRGHYQIRARANEQTRQLGLFVDGRRQQQRVFRW